MNRGIIEQMQAELRRRAVYFGLALAPLLAWLVLSAVYIGLLIGHGDFVLAGHQAGDPLFPRLRQLDALWAWVGLTLFHLLVLRANDRRWMDLVVWLALAGGVTMCVARQLVPVEMRFTLQLAECGCTAVGAALAVGRMAMFLSGRQVEIGDVWAFVGLQWMLVWTGANAFLTCTQGPAGISEERRLVLFQLATLGMGVNVLTAMGLRWLKSATGAVVRQRAGLLALAVYNAGVIVLLCGPKWVGAGLMLVALPMLGVALWPQRGQRLGVILPVVALAAAVSILPWENSAFSAWRHAAAAGVVGMGTLGAAVVAMIAVSPKRWRPKVLPGLGLGLFAAGVAARVATEFVMGARGTAVGLGVSAGLELVGAVVVGVALVRGMRRLGGMR